MLKWVWELDFDRVVILKGNVFLFVKLHKF